MLHAGSSDGHGGKETAPSAAASPSTSLVQSALPQEQERHTGEEGETVLYEAEGTLFQFDDQDTKQWRERGRGDLRVNKAPNGESSRSSADAFKGKACIMPHQPCCRLCSLQSCPAQTATQAKAPLLLGWR